MILLVVVGCYLVAKFIPPYWTYLSLLDPVKEATLSAVRDGSEARAQEDLIRRAKEQGLTLTEENIEFIRQGPMLVLRVTWIATVDLPGYRYEIPFQIDHKIPLR